MSDFGKILITLGIVLVVVGAVVMLLGRTNLPVGRLPGDLSWRSKSGNTRVYFPLATSILVSVVLSLVLWVIANFRK